MGGKPRTLAFSVPRASVRATVRVSSVGPDAPLYIDAPRPILDPNSTARIAVRGRLGGASFTGAIVLLGGRQRLVVNRELAAASGVYNGARVTLELERIGDPALTRSM